MDKYGRKDGWEMMRECADAESEIINDMRSPLAKARDKWLLSEDGKECCHGTATGQYLQNRLERAFIAGYSVVAELRIKELEVALGEATIELAKKYATHKDNCAYIQGLRGSTIEKCDCGFEQALKG